MDTYTPMRAMIVCANGTGDYIKKEDAIKALQNIFEEDSQKIIEVFLKEFGYEDGKVSMKEKTVIFNKI